jgi:hypothetical protein
MTEMKPFVVKRPLVMAFFQMNWFSVQSGERLTRLHQFYRDHNEWRDMLSHTQSGRTLKTVFKDLYETIVWRMPNPGPKKNPVYRATLERSLGEEIPDYDEAYIRHLLANVKPEIVIGLGTSASKGIGQVACQVPVKGAVLFGKHPLETGATESLINLAVELRTELEHYDA